MLDAETKRRLKHGESLNRLEAELLDRMPQLQAARATAVLFGSGVLFGQCLRDENTAADVMALVEYAARTLRRREMENLLLEGHLPGA